MSVVDWPADAAGILGAQRAALLVSRLAPGQGFDHLHAHARHTEVFVVRAGVVRVRTGSAVTDLEPGMSAFVPPGTAHSFVATGEDDAEVAIVVSPPDVLSMILELGAVGDDRTAIDAVLARYDSRLV